MQVFTQKYTIAYIFQPLPDGFEYPMDKWPPHITLADVFAIDGPPAELLARLNNELRGHAVLPTKVTDDAWFGPHKNVHVKLLDKTDELQQLHEQIVQILGEFNAIFNTPRHMGDGFKPHSTVHGDETLKTGDEITIDSITLIDMFPDQDHRQRRVLGTVHF